MENAGRVSNKTYAVSKENKSYTLVSLAGLSKEELDKEFQKGIDSLKNDKTYSIDEVDAFFMKKYGI
jgi:addiction module antitoxin, relB/dinJ family